MAFLERKQVLRADDQISEAVSQVNAPSEAIGVFTSHGLIKDLTILGTNFEAKPVAEILPKITGNQQVGQVLTCVDGVYSKSHPLPVTRTRAWKNNGAPIGGATAQTYTLVAGDSGDLITVTETVTDGFGASVSATSLPTGAIAA